jgi:hypothetical protein
MEKKSKTPLVYGYAVCLVAVITFLITVAGVIFAVIDLGDPLYASNSYNKASIASFENYKMDILKSKADEESWSPDDETLRAMYESEKNDRINKVKHDSNRSLIINGALLLISIILFLTHWRWMRKTGKLM